MFLDVPEASEPMTGDRCWARYQPFLRHRGYELRPRYQPDWRPSWKGKVKDELELWGKYEDYLGIFPITTIDAIRVRDGVKVAIRCTERLDRPEISNLLYLNSPEMRADPRNRTVPVLDILILPDRAFIIMPMLMHFHNLPFRRMGELSEAMGQIIQGIVFMHKQRMIHHDACLFNIMMDPSKIVPSGFHFARWDKTDGYRRKTIWKERWSVRPTNYYFIDFETSFRFPPLLDPSNQHMIVYAGPVGQDKTIPEFTDGSKFYDGFKVDVYQVGNALRRVSVCYEDLSIFDPLFAAMTCSNPERRVSAAEAYQLFRDIVDSWSEEQLSQRIWFKGTTRWNRFLIRHFRKNVAQVLPTYINFESPEEYPFFNYISGCYVI